MLSKTEFTDLLICPYCQSELKKEKNLLCSNCKKEYKVDKNIYHLLKSETSQEEIDVQDAVSDDYEDTRYSKSYSISYQKNWFKQIEKFVAKEGLVLDNGCGIGNFANLLSNKNIIGLDISSGMLNKATKRMDFLINGDSQNLPFKDEIFDTVICRGLLHHVPNKEKAVGECFRVLKDGGNLVVAEPIKSSLSLLPRKLIKKSEHFSSTHMDFEKKELTQMISNKFKINKIKHFGYVAYPLLGFPDIVDIYKHVPLKKIITPTLICTDSIISKIPLINTQSWGVLINAKKVKK